MNINTARTFLEVVNAGNLNRAAERLNVTQSTVTTRLDALERTVGQKLLVRSKSGTELTSAGFKFQRYAEMLVQTWDLARREIGLPKDFRGVCNIGCHRELWYALGETWCQRLRREHSDIALSIWSGSDADLGRWIGSTMIDVALMFDSAGSGNWSVRPLFDEELVQVATVAREVQRWDPGYVYVDLGADFRRQHAQAYPVDETPVVTFDSARWALDHILEWGGSAYLPARLVQTHLDSARLYRVNGAPSFRRTCYIAFNNELVAGWEWFEPSLEALIGDLSDRSGT